MNKIFSILLSPFIIALIITIPIIIFMPSINKYKINLIDSSTPEKEEGTICYEDLNNDGNSEYIIIYNNVRGSAAIKICDYNDLVIDQWNFQNKLTQGPKNNSYLIGDYDNNNFKEIYLFTQNDDSIFLNVVEPLKKNGLSIQKKFISCIDKVDGKIDFVVNFQFLRDLNNDKFKDITFRIIAGFSLQPRKIYIYDIANNELIKSPDIGCKISLASFYDINNDNRLEIFTFTSAPNNMADSSEVPYTDKSAWLMVLTDHLTFLFEPIEFKRHKPRLLSMPYISKGKKYILVFLNYLGESSKVIELFLYNSSGKLIRKSKLPENFNQYNRFYYPSEKETFNHIYLYDNCFNSLILNEEFEIMEERKSNLPQVLRYKELDIDNDNQDEKIIFCSEKQQLIITRNDLAHPVSVSIPIGYFEKIFCSLKYDTYNNRNLFVQLNNNCYLFEYSMNRLYYLRFPIYIGIYLLAFLFIYILQKLQKIQLQKKYATERSFAELQLKTIRNQVDPHFTFNAINSIAAVVNKEHREDVYNFFTSFSMLIRSSLEQSDKISRTLSEEIDFVKNYLELEKFRFEDKFDYKVNIDKDIDMKFLVPKMVLQIYVENSVKHGLIHKDKKGELKIDIHKDNNLLLLIVEDNGIGRKKAKTLSEKGTGKGILIMDEFYDLYNKYNNTKITYEIIDLYDSNNEACGTKVVVKLPIK